MDICPASYQTLRTPAAIIRYHGREGRHPMSNDEATIDDYLRAPDALAALLDGLTDADLDRARAPGEWTVRQTAHHLIEGDLLWTMGLKVATVHPGVLWKLTWYDNDSWVAALDYAHQPVGPALAL